VDNKYQISIISFIKYLLILSVICIKIVFAQVEKNDTLYVKAGSTIEFLNTFVTVHKDTVLILPQDTKYIIYEASDSTSKQFYKSIKTYSQKSKWLELLHNSIIIEKKTLNNQNTSFDRSSEEYKNYEGKIIANIRHKKVRLFTGSVFDTTNLINQENEGLFEKIHYDTKDDVIAKYLTFSVGEELDPHRISDSERILRGLSFIEDARIILISQKDDVNKIDVVVVTKDRFSLGINLNPHSITRISTTFFNRNVLGNGWNFELRYIFNDDYTPPHGIDTKINFFNIRGWFVDATMQYYYDEESEGAHLSFVKPFITVETKYGGGLDLENIHSYRLDENLTRIPYTNNYEDFWIGRQISISKKNRNKTLIFSARVSRKDFTSRPRIEPDSNYFFYNQYLGLGSLIYSDIDHYKARLIYGFGITEDIPVGMRIGITSGVIYDDFYDYFYLGLDGGQAIISKSFGYLLGAFKLGGVYDRGEFRHGMLYFYSQYISPLIPKGKFYLRHFLYASYTEGLNRQRDFNVHLIDKNGIRGLGLGAVEGIKRLFFSYEGVLFTPFNFYGFRVAMFGFADAGFIGNDIDFVFQNKMYSGIGVGWRIKNESLVFNAIQIRLAYYPNTAPGGSSFGFDIKTNETRLFENIFPVKPEILDVK